MIRFRLPILAVILALAATLTANTVASASIPPQDRQLAAAQAVFHPTAAQKAHLEKVVSTANGRKKLLAALEHSYGKFARVGLGSTRSTGRSMTPYLSDGITWDHVWVIASYADVYRGLVTTAENFCVARSPVKWICYAIGTFLYNMTWGHPWTDSHGIWVAYYWWPYLHETGGLW